MNELEKAGMPVAHVTAIPSVAKSVGSTRIVRGEGIVNLLGNAALEADEERKLRREIVLRALEALTTAGVVTS